MIRRSIAVLPLALSLAALTGCGDDAPPAAQGSSDASSKVLEGTISDEMLPLDTLTSQPPLMVEKAASTDEDDEDAEEGTEAEADAEPATPAQTPAAAEAETAE